ncbi:MAG TPA: LamG-like jellyroll fold domain-containing protein [Polyangiaceae bacterium]
MPALRAMVAAAASVALFATAACSLLYDPDDLTRDRDKPLGDAAASNVDAASGSYAAAVLADAPLGYYRFDDASGSTTAADSSPHHTDCSYSDGVVHGGKGALEGDSSTSIRFGGHDFVSCGDHFSFDGDVPFSIELWIQVDLSTAFDTFYRRLLSREGSDPNAQQGYGVLFHREDRLLVELTRWDVSSGKPQYSGGTFDGNGTLATTSGFDHVVFTYTSGRVVFYVNDKVVVDDPSSGTIQNASSAIFVLGATTYDLPDEGAGFVGSMDEVAIYDHVLTSDRVDAHYRAATGR